MNTSKDLPKLTVFYPTRVTPHGNGTSTVEIMLGKHKKTPGAEKLCMVGKYNGPGGKLKPDIDQTTEHCAQREVQEEFGIKPVLDKIVKAGIIQVNNNGFECEIYFFFGDTWDGDVVTESREFTDIRWHNINKLPYENMMDADRKYWLPLMLHSAMMRKKILRTNITHNEKMEVTSCTVFQYDDRQ